MSHDIKRLKPSKSGRYQQGYINPASCKKLFSGLTNDKIIYRSSYEKKFIYWLEHSKSVQAWGSECLGIKYTSALDGKTHTYYPDYLVQMADGEFVVIEIKPYNQTVRPVNENSYAWHEWARNISKWAATKKYCDSRGLKFKILTEKTINRL